MTTIRKQRQPDASGHEAGPGVPPRAGASFFFEIRHRWEVRALMDDEGVRKVYSPAGLEDAFHDPAVRTVLIPAGSTIARVVALRVCARHGHGKTVFFEMPAG